MFSREKVRPADQCSETGTNNSCTELMVIAGPANKPTELLGMNLKQEFFPFKILHIYILATFTVNLPKRSDVNLMWNSSKYLFFLVHKIEKKLCEVFIMERLILQREKTSLKSFQIDLQNHIVNLACCVDLKD